MTPSAEETILAAARAGDESAFTALVERHRGELRVHCYRMLGSFEESEDLVQETFLRAWKGLPGFEGRSTLRAWLYRIATNACLDFLDGRQRRVLPHQLAPPRSRPWSSRHAPTCPGCSRSLTDCVSRPRPSRTLWSSPGRPSSWRSWPPSSTCPRGSGRC